MIEQKRLCHKFTIEKGSFTEILKNINGLTNDL